MRSPGKTCLFNVHTAVQNVDRKKESLSVAYGGSSFPSGLFHDTFLNVGIKFLKIICILKITLITTVLILQCINIFCIHTRLAKSITFSKQNVSSSYFSIC